MVACPYAGITRIRFRVEAVRGASARASSQPESSSSPYVGRSIARALGTFQPIATAQAIAMNRNEPVPNESIPFGRESGGVRRPSRFGVASPRPSNWRYCR